VNAPVGLRRAIRLPHATALVVGTIIGASIFVQPSEITSRVPSVAGVLLVWLLAGGLTLAGALLTAELASSFSRGGGVYVYLTEAYGPPLGFLWGWAMFWSMHSGIIAAIAVVFARYAGYLIPLGPWEAKTVAIGVILLLSGVNYLGVKQGSRLQSLFTAGKLLAVAAIVLLGFGLGGRVSAHFVGSGSRPGSITLVDFLAGLAAGLFAFGGWHMVTYSSEETVAPRTTIPRALALGTAIVTLSYLLMNAVYLYVLPLDRVARSTRVAADLADTLLGTGGGNAISAVVLFSTFGALAGIVLTGPRVYLAMAQDGLLFRWLSGVHPRFQTPHRAIVLQAGWASVLVATGTFRVLFTRVVYTEWIFFGLLALGLMRLRKRGAPRDYSVPLYPVLPVVFALVSFVVVGSLIAQNPKETLAGLGLVLLGIPVYFISRRGGPRPLTPDS
jgi:APA family basic amino acid/polyamine antiporter